MSGDVIRFMFMKRGQKGSDFNSSLANEIGIVVENFN